MSTTVQYKGNTLATVSNDTKTLKTAGKYMEGDVSITDNSGSEQGTVWQDAEGYLHLDDESGISLQTKSATPSETAQTIKPDAGYYALDKVNVGAISSTYVGSGITRRSSTDLTVSGATVTVPSGYYSAAASKSVASMTLPTAAATSATSGYTKKATIGRSTSTQYINIGTGYNSAGGYYEISAVANGTAGTPTATKGTVSNHSISVTPSVTNTTGYITGGTKSGTAVSVSASELVSGTLSITQNGTGIDVTDYASVNVSVPSSGEDVPVFTLDISTNPPTATCNKTFAECEAYISSNNTVAILNAPLASTTFSMVAYNYVASYMIVYAIYDSNGYPIADIGWTIGGGIVYSEPSVLHENLPTAPASTSSGTLQSTISSSTSTRYLNIRRGYYPQDKYYTLSAMPTGTAGTPTATKGTVSNHSVSVTPSVTNTTGYITGSTKTGTAVTVSASELVSGTFTGVSSYGTYDVTNYASVQVSGGSEGTPTATKGTVSNHSVSVTPSVTNVRGYITGSTKTGTAVTVSASELVSGTLSITQNGTADVTNYASVNVNVPTGSPTLKTKNITANGTYNASSDNADGYSSVTVNVPTGGSGGWTLLQTTNLGNLSTSSTTATDTGLTLTASGLNPYDTVAIIISVNTKVAGRHVATIRIYTAYGSSDASVKSGGTTSNVYLNYVLNTSNVLTSRTGTAGYGVYPSTITFSTSNNGTITMPIYYRYSATHTDVIDGNYTARIYGANLYDLIGG